MSKRPPTARAAASLTQAVIAGLLCLPSATAHAANGFFVNADGYFLSAHHVVRSCETMIVKTPAGALLAEHVAASNEEDLAVIKISGRREHYGRFPMDPAQALRTTLTILRKPRKDRAAERMTTARYLGRSPNLEGKILVRAREEINAGDSGSPVLAQTGEVVGLLVAKSAEQPRIGIAVDVFTMTRFLSDAGVRFETQARASTRQAFTAEDIGLRFTFPVYCHKKRVHKPE